jgi:SnoaL-like domain
MMPTPDTLERFILRVEENAHAEAIEEFYTANASMQENQSPPRVGRDALAANERRVLARAKAVSSRCIRPVFVCGDRVVIRWIFRFEWLDGTFTHMEELAYQRWMGEHVVEETFFYDPAQLMPRNERPDQPVIKYNLPSSGTSG